jgi:predicted lipoprotein with Yx(FWY)xxD motif
MTMSRRNVLPVLGAAAALGLAACGGSGGGSYGGGGAATSTPPATDTATPNATIRTSSTNLGRILVDAQGRTVYLFKKDPGTKSACSGACATAWPPVVTTAKPAAGSGVKASLLGTTTRSDGKRQVTYNGHPLYLYVGDQGPGDTNGEGSTGFGALWLALSPAGNGVSA